MSGCATSSKSPSSREAASSPTSSPLKAGAPSPSPTSAKAPWNISSTSTAWGKRSRAEDRSQETGVRSQKTGVRILHRWRRLVTSDFLLFVARPARGAFLFADRLAVRAQAFESVLAPEGAVV